MNVLITGAGRGIGRGISTVLAANRHAVGLLGRSEPHLREVADAIAASEGVCAYSVCDIRDATAVTESVAELCETLGGIEALVNNAGLIIRKDIFDLSVAEWEAMINTNVNGLFYVTRTVLPLMRNRGRGHIINVSSISGRLPLAGGSGYAASKYAVTGFSESLFHEVRNFGIKVTTIFPGSVNSRGDGDSWKVTAEEVGQACVDVLQTAAHNCISRLEIRPLKKPL